MINVTAEIEQSLIGTILTTPEKLVSIVDHVRDEDFSDGRAKKAFVIALGLWRNNQTVNMATVAAADMSLATYLVEAAGKYTPSGYRDFPLQVAAAAKERRVLSGLDQIRASKDRIEDRLDKILSLYQGEMFVDKKNPDIKEVLKRFNKHVSTNRNRGAMGISTGFPFMEEKYIQYVQGHIWTLGAYTSVGKTAVMIQQICNLIVAENTPSIVVVSTEMTEEQVIARMLANFTGVHSFRILAGNYRQGEEEVVEEYRRLLASKPLKIYDDVYKIGDIETVFRKADLQGGVDIGWIDYVQNCQNPEATSEYQAQSGMAKRLQKLAKDVRMTLVCLSQVSNDVGRGNTENLELKGAGEWAAVSDVGIMLVRSNENNCRLKFSVKKNRHGALLERKLEYKNDFTRIEDIGPVS